MSKRSAKKGATDGAGAATKKACTGTAAGDSQSKAAQVEEEEANNVFSHDLDTLQCDICFTLFKFEIYMCKNGHAACGICCVQLHRKCPSCNESIGDIRCRAMEKILAGMSRPCKFKKHGCKQVLKFTEVRIHEEETCLYRPYPCPFDGCTYFGGDLSGHMQAQTDHGSVLYEYFSGRVTVILEKSRRISVLLPNILEDGNSVFLLLNGGDVPRGSSLSLVRIYPRPAPADEDGGAQVAQQYTIAVKGNQPGSTFSLTASGSVPFVRRIEGYKAQEFLFVPDACWGSSQTVVVTVTVKLALS